MYSLFFVVRPHGCFETEEDLNHRLDVLSRLNDLVRQWIKVGAFQQSRYRSATPYHSIPDPEARSGSYSLLQ
jgi:hypothetical protein